MHKTQALTSGLAAAICTRCDMSRAAVDQHHTLLKEKRVVPISWET